MVSPATPRVYNACTWLLMLSIICMDACAAAGDNSIDKADIKRLKESGVFGPLTFWVTEIKNLEELGNPNAAVSPPDSS